MGKGSMLQEKKERLYSKIHVSVRTLDIIITVTVIALVAVLIFGRG